MPRRFLLTFLLSCAAATAQQPAPISDAAGFAQKVVPLFKDHCLKCHGPEKQKGDFRVDTGLPQDFLDVLAKEKWGGVVNVLNSHEMPPEKEKQPPPAQVGAAVDWITALLVRAELVRRDGTVVLRRLNRDEYRNTIRDLTGVDSTTIACGCRTSRIPSSTAGRMRSAAA